MYYHQLIVHGQNVSVQFMRTEGNSSDIPAWKVDGAQEVIAVSEQTNIMENPLIKSDGTVFDGERVIRVFKVETQEKSFWFEFNFEVAENGIDEWIVVSNFGLARREAAGSKTPLVRWKFTPLEAQTAQARLRDFFLGSKERNVPAFPLIAGAQSKSRLLGVKFPNGWITLK